MVKKIGIVGMGVSGKGLKKFCQQQGIETICYDDFQEEYRDNNYFDVEAVYFSPGIAIENTKRHYLVEEFAKRSIPMLNDFDLLYAWQYNKIFIGVTGTAGKTTTSRLIYHFLQHNNINCILAGNIGNDIFIEADVYVLELSSTHLSRTNYICFDYGVITNLYQDHIDFFEHFSRYKAAKYNILRHNTNKKQKYYLGPGCDYDISDINLLNIQSFKEINNLQNLDLKKTNNIQNIQVALSIIEDMGLSREKSIDSLEFFQLDSYRQTTILKNEQLQVINDSKCTNITAFLSALENYDNITWIAGGHLKYQFHIEDISLTQCKNKIQKAIFFGESANFFYETFNKYLDCQIISSIDDLSSILHPNTIGTILFSPIGSSHDAFNNYKDRGQKFTEIINQIF